MMKTTTRFMSFLLASALAVTAMPALTEARELNYALGAPSGTPAHKAVRYFAEQVGEISEGDLTVRVYPLSLLSFAEMSAGLRDGIGDIGLVLTPYHPGEYPPINFLSETSMLTALSEDLQPGKEGLAFAAAMSEYVAFHCPECISSYQAQNQVYIGHTAGTGYGLMCTEKVTSPSELRGKRVRVGAGNFSRWAEAMGAVPVTLSANDMREALGQGIVDCVALSSIEIQNFGLTELVSDITMTVPGGVFPHSAFQTNRDVWRSLSVEQRGYLIRAAARGAAALSWIYHEEAEETFDLVRGLGTRFHTADEELIAASTRFIEKDMETLIEQYQSRYGLNRAAEMLEEFQPVLEAWIGRVADVNTQEELAALYWEHIMSRLDPATWGL